MARAPSNIVYLESPEKGVDGRGILTLARDPVISDGRIGDFIIQSVTKKLYGPKNAGGWPDLGLIRGAQGWAPKLVAEADGTRRVFKISDWTGGEGAKPATGYLADDGSVVPDIEDAADFRGGEGPQALINALGAKTDSVSYETLTALAESSSDNEKAAIKRIFEAGGAMPFRSRSEAQAAAIPAAVKVLQTQFYAPNYADPMAMAGGARYRRVNAEPLHALKLRSSDRWTAEGNHDSANGGWWEIYEEFVTPDAANAVSDGSAVDTAAVKNAWDAASSGMGGIYLAPFGLQNTPGTFPISSNWALPTYMRHTKATRMALFDGSPAMPSSESDDPVLWVQKHTSYDNGVDATAHSAGSVFDVIVYGSNAPAVDVDGTWTSLFGNSVLLGKNVGTEGDPNYDLRGSAIGVTGFARSEKPAGITTAVWGYASTPVMNQTEFDAFNDMSYPTVGVEVNIDIRTPDAGYKTGFGGKGITAGYLGYNYRPAGQGVRDWSFGFILSGSPNDGDFTSPDVDNWSGFYVGARLDFIKRHGIEFGRYFKADSYGIRFPDSYVGTQAPAAAIHLGNSKLQMGQYTGVDFRDRDLWNNAGSLFYRNGATTERLLKQAGSVITGNAAANWNFTPFGGAQQFNIGYVANAVNFLGVHAAPAGGTSALVAQGADVNRSIELRTAGTGRVWIGPHTAGGDAAITGYIEVKDSAGINRKLAVIA